MTSFYYVGLDVYKKTIRCCVKTAAGTIEATRPALTGWTEALPGPWVGALEAWMSPSGE